MSDHESHDVRFWFGFFLGGLIGAIVLFFIGTKEGQDTGKKLRKSGEEFADELQERLEELKEKGRQLAEDSEDLKEEISDTLKERKKELTADATKKIDDTLAHIEAIQERGRKTTANIRKGIFKNTPKKS